MSEPVLAPGMLRTHRLITFDEDRIATHNGKHTLCSASLEGARGIRKLACRRAVAVQTFKVEFPYSLAQAPPTKRGHMIRGTHSTAHDTPYPLTTLAWRCTGNHSMVIC